MPKLKFVQNSDTIDTTNSGLDTIIFGLEEVLGILDLRSLGYYKIKQGILQQHLSTYSRPEKADILCKQFNEFISTLKKERQQEEAKEKYLWLDPSDEKNTWWIGKYWKSIKIKKIMFNGQREKRSNGYAMMKFVIVCL